MGQGTICVRGRRARCQQRVFRRHQDREVVERGRTVEARQADPAKAAKTRAIHRAGIPTVRDGCIERVERVERGFVTGARVCCRRTR